MGVRQRPTTADVPVRPAQVLPAGRNPQRKPAKPCGALIRVWARCELSEPMHKVASDERSATPQAHGHAWGADLHILNAMHPSTHDPSGPVLDVGGPPIARCTAWALAGQVMHHKQGWHDSDAGVQTCTSLTPWTPQQMTTAGRSWRATWGAPRGPCCRTAAPRCPAQTSPRWTAWHLHTSTLPTSKVGPTAERLDSCMYVCLSHCRPPGIG